MFIFNKKEYKNRFLYTKSEIRKLVLKSLLADFFLEREKKYL